MNVLKFVANEMAVGGDVGFPLAHAREGRGHRRRRYQRCVKCDHLSSPELGRRPKRSRRTHPFLFGVYFLPFFSLSFLA